MAEQIERYGCRFQPGFDDLQVEFFFIKAGGYATMGGRRAGNGLSFHYERARNLLWPELDDQRWHRLCRDEILKNKVTVLMGPASSGKTHEAAWTALVDYWVHPEDTCVLVSSTDIRGLKKRVWGEITMLWERGIERFPWLPGELLDSAIAITTDNLEDCEPGERRVRDMRRGIFGVPCVQGGKFFGLQKFQGIKQKRMRLVADEASAMNESFLSSFSNLSKNEDFKAIILGNPNDPLDPLGRAAEPKEGWTDEYMSATKTTCWDTRFMGGRCVNLIGLDSPNFDFPPEQPTRYKYLISREKIQDTLSFFQKDSIEYYSQCVGSMKIGTMARRVITRKMCEQYGAFEDVVWDGAIPVKTFAGLDSAYGGDRCALTKVELGTDLKGKQMLRVYPAVIVPILVNSPSIAEVQIAEFCKNYCQDNDIPPEHFGHDSTGRGSLGTFLAQAWSSSCVPVEFGGRPTKRPVSLDLSIIDQETGVKRLKRCDEHFIKWVTEAWFVIRMAIEAGQIKTLPEETMNEGCLREFEVVQDKYELESKRDMKERVGRSPDLFDSLAVAVEMARRRGFQISKLANPSAKKPKSGDFLAKFAQEHEDMMKKHELQTI